MEEKASKAKAAGAAAKKAAPAKKAAAKTTTAKKTTKKKTAKKKTGTLVIVESPAKAHTIEKMLGKGYRVTASQGHVRDLPKSELGVDVENNFEPKYVQVRTRGSVMKTIKDEAKTAERVLLATDPDREGEAISWHIAQVLGIDEHDNCRIEFNEITKQAVEHSLESPRPIDMGRVNAQQARRILDRLVGYKISPILWRKVRKGLSAGRVQSVAVRMICDRDREIENFKPVEYWSIEADFSENTSNTRFSANLEKIKNKKIDIKNENEAQAIAQDAQQQEYIIAKVKKGQRKRKAPPPFTTSTMQQEAARKLNLSPANTMRIAQQLYEGIDTGEGEVGLITYMRTDSMRIANEALDEARAYIEKRFGKEYLPDEPIVYRNRRNAQDAHEAIRPTSVLRSPQSLENFLDRNQMRLYELIFNRFLACQMGPEVSDTISADVVGGDYTFRTTGSKVRFPGYRAAYQEGSDEKEEKESGLVDLDQGAGCKIDKLRPNQHFTQPPARFSDASLVKALEEKGIGRPSTYATIISTIIDREYVEREGRQLHATPLGFVVTDLLKDNFTDIVDEEFTAEMETKLDAVEEGGDWHKTLSDFYEPFEKTLEDADKIERVKLPVEETDIKCEKCGANMVVKTGRFGKFLACPNFPECRNTKPLVEEIDVPCPKCGGKVVKKKSKKGRMFFGCEKYPACDWVSWYQPVKEKCSVCGGDMVLRTGRDKSEYRECTNEECKHKETVKSNEDG